MCLAFQLPQGVAMVAITAQSALPIHKGLFAIQDPSSATHQPATMSLLDLFHHVVDNANHLPFAFLEVRSPIYVIRARTVALQD